MIEFYETIKTDDMPADLPLFLKIKTFDFL